MKSGLLMACVFSLISGVFGFKATAADYQVAEVYADLRKMVLETKPTDIGLKPSDAQMTVLGLLMETGYPEAVVTLVAIADGTVSIYFSNGGGIIGLGPHEGPWRASEALLKLAPQFLKFCQPASSFPLPKPSNTRFYVLTNKGIVTAEVKEVDLVYGRHGLSPLFHKGHELISEIRVVDEKLRAEPGAELGR